MYALFLTRSILGILSVKIVFSLLSHCMNRDVGTKVDTWLGTGFQEWICRLVVDIAGKRSSRN